MTDADQQESAPATIVKAPLDGGGDDGVRSGSGGNRDEEIEAITVMSRGSATPLLAERIAEARARWPEDFRLLLLEGATLRKLGRPGEAEACFRQARAARPENPWPGVRLMELLLEQRRRDEAAVIFQSDLWPGALPEEVRGPLLSRICTVYTDLSERRVFLAGLLRGTAADRFVLLKLAAISFREKDKPEAQRLFDAAKSLGPLPIESQSMELELLLASNRFDEAFSLATALHGRHPDRPDFARRAIQAAHFSNRTSEMLALLREALDRWPGDWLMAFRYNRCTIPMHADRELFALMSRRDADGGNDDRWSFQFAIACLRHGRTDRAMAILAQIPSASPVHWMAAPLRAALSAYPASLWQNARRISNDPERDVQVVRVAGAAATVIVLPGVQGGLGYLPFSHVDGLLSRHPVNVIYLRDLNTRAFTAGVRGLGPDQDSMITALKSLTREFDAPVVTMGSSVGGVVAIRTAALMNAQAALSFAGPVFLAADTSEDDIPIPRAKSVRGTLFSGFAQSDISLIEMIRHAPRTRVFHCYGGDYAPDVESAELLRPLPNAVLCPLAGCADHFVVEHMMADHSFGRLLERAIHASSLVAS